MRRASQHHEIHTDRQAQVHPNGIVYYHQDRLNVTTTANLREIDGWDPLVTLAQSNIGANANSAAVRASEGWEVLVELDGVTWIDHARQAASELNEDFMAFRERLRDLDGSASGACHALKPTNLTRASQIRALALNIGASSSAVPTTSC